MHSSNKRVIELLLPYGPQEPVPQLVEELNRLYHGAEAADYDRNHPEIFDYLPSIWKEMIARALVEMPSQPWHILNFGCGTGFEAEQLIRSLERHRIASLTCYDPSSEMLERCRTKIAPLLPDAVFVADSHSIPRRKGCYNYDVCATNSVLHHLPDPLAVLRELYPLLSKKAIWLAGHEPSPRFYRNPECVRVFQRFLHWHTWRKYLSPRKYAARLLQAFGVKVGPAHFAAREAYRKGLFKKEPPARLIGLLVDYHAPHSTQEAEDGRGFDYEDLEEALDGQWSLVWLKTYNFMGCFPEHGLPPGWRNASERLAARFPYDGAAFCSLWKRS